MKVAALLTVRFLTALHFLIGAYEGQWIDKEMALEKLEKLSAIGRYNKHILTDAKRRLGGGA